MVNKFFASKLCGLSSTISCRVGAGTGSNQPEKECQKTAQPAVFLTLLWALRIDQLSRRQPMDNIANLLLSLTDEVARYLKENRVLRWMALVSSI